MTEDGAARLLFPAIRWDPAAGFAPGLDAAFADVELGVGGFIVFGGEARAVRDLTAELRARAGHPLLIGADLERGAGQQFGGATSLPPLSAIGHLDALDVTRRAGLTTAREALALGVDWVYGPVADLDAKAGNPIVGTRAFGARPGRVADHVRAWVEGSQSTGAMACVKHFPGHGRTTTDSHAGLPVVDAGAGTLEDDLRPFTAAIRAGVASVMSAHVAYPALDPSGVPATLSRAILDGLLRRRLGFGGIVVTDALIMEGVLSGQRAGGTGTDAAGAAGVRALAAGCDALLYPEDARGALAAIREALARGDLDAGSVRRSVARIDAAAIAAAAARAAGAGGWGSPEDRDWALSIARASLVPLAGRCDLPAGAVVRVRDVDDDLGGPYPPPARTAFPGALREAGMRVSYLPDPRAGAEATVPDRPVEGDPAVATPPDGERGDGARQDVIAVYADIRAWKGRPGLSDAALASVSGALAERPDAIVVAFAHPRLASALDAGRVLAAWGGEPIMQEAVAAALAGAR